MRFSIITPSFRNSGWLKLCVASVADQQVELEHIVQDAGSDDGTLDWLRDDRRVQLHVEPDQGMYDGINRGLRKAKGEVLAYLNCDEQYLPGALASVEKFFAAHPAIDVVFAHSVAVDGAGRYLWHRKVLVPTLAHTAVCNLSVLTCATFFRRRLIDQGLFFDTKWRYYGDCEWVLRLLHHKVPMAVLPQFTSVFTHTGANLSLATEARAEARKFWAGAPRWNRMLRSGILLHHRARRLLRGVYFQKPFTFDLYTVQSPHQRITQQVDQPTFRWRW